MRAVDSRFRGNDRDGGFPIDTLGNDIRREMTGKGDSSLRSE